MDCQDKDGTKLQLQQEDGNLTSTKPTKVQYVWRCSYNENSIS